MYYSKKRTLEDVPKEMTVIWSCPTGSCNGWMRDNFTFSSTPACPRCQAQMIKTEKMLEIVANTSPIHSS